MSWSLAVIFNQLGLFNIATVWDSCMDEVVVLIYISYCLGITNICPLELDLYFERF
jgi:hypothetical protein